MYTKGEIIFSASNINKTFGDKVVLRDINFSIRNITRPGIKQGQIISLIGKSGSGKSTLFNIIARLLMSDDEDSARIHFGPPTVVTEPVRKVKEGDIGVVFQNSYIYEWRKVSWLLTHAAKRGFKDNWENACKDVCHHFEIENHWDKYSSQLSGGQKQRVAIAEQLLGGNDFILLDEPFSGLDTLTIDRVTKMLVDVSLTDELKTLIIVSHDLSNSLAISDTALILSKEEGKEGTTITNTFDLVEMGLAWRPDIKDQPEFRELINHIKTII